MEQDERLPISFIKQFIYCKRRFALMSIDNEWSDNHKIIEGNILHEKVDNPFIKESRGNMFFSRSVPVYSEKLNVQGICDIIEFKKSENGIKVGNKKGLWDINPIEYKNGKVEKSNADFYQLCTVAMCLEEMFDVTIKFGEIYYGKLKRRHLVEFSSELTEKIFFAIKEMQEIIKLSVLPAKDKNQNCSLCSLYDICMPNIFDNKSKIEMTMSKLKKGTLL